MLFFSEQTTAQMTELFEETRSYWQLQKRYLSLHTAEVLARLFSTIALWAVFILVGFIVMLFASFALAIWLGSLLHSQMAGFAVIAAVLFAATLVVYANRVRWIVMPVTRFMVGLLAAEVKQVSREAIALEKARLQDQLEHDQAELRTTAVSILEPPAESRNKWESASQLFQNGMSVYRGIQLGISVIAAARALFRPGKRKRR